VAGTALNATNGAASWPSDQASVNATNGQSAAQLVAQIGSTPLARATADASGNTITTTYATQAALAASTNGANNIPVTVLTAGGTLPAENGSALTALTPGNITGWPVNASGYLNNNGSGTLTWGTPSGGGGVAYYGANTNIWLNGKGGAINYFVLFPTNTTWIAATNLGDRVKFTIEFRGMTNLNVLNFQTNFLFGSDLTAIGCTLSTNLTYGSFISSTQMWAQVVGWSRGGAGNGF
jgi:hypothetical protein